MLEVAQAVTTYEAHELVYEPACISEAPGVEVDTVSKETQTRAKEGHMCFAFTVRSMVSESY